MRKADFDTAWKELRSERLPTLSINSLSVASEDGSQVININSRVIAFVGPNGAGKSGFLNGFSSFVKNGECTSSRINIQGVDGRFRGKLFSVDSKSSAPKDLSIELIDVSAEVHKIRNYFISQTCLDELIESHEVNIPNKENQGLYKHVTRLPYAAVGVREIEAPVSPTIDDESVAEVDYVYPFFEIKSGDIEYTLLSMGLGELCACFLVWKLLRSDKGQIFLLDEPDAHLSPASRRALIDAIGFISHSRQLWVGLTTHSVELLEPLTLNETFLITSDPFSSNTRIDPVERKRTAFRELGLAQVRKLLILVEDLDSKVAVWTLVNRWGNSVSSAMDVVIVDGGCTSVADFLVHFPLDSRICKAIAVLDGDKRSDASLANLDNIIFLPGSKDPIEESRLIALDQCENLSRIINVDRTLLHGSLLKLLHVDHHDFLSALHDELGLEGRTVADMRKAVILNWLSSENFIKSGNELVEEIIKYVDDADIVIKE